MAKPPSPRADGLRAMREARFAKAQEAQKAWAAAEAKVKPKKRASKPVPGVATP